MKIIIALLLALSGISNAEAIKIRVYELVALSCNADYVKGTKTVLSNKQVLWRCFRKGYIPENYETDLDVKCSPTHTEAKWFYSSNNLHYKECIETQVLGYDYSTYEYTECANGYESDGEVSYDDVIFPHKVCRSTYAQR